VRHGLSSLRHPPLKNSTGRGSGPKRHAPTPESPRSPVLLPAIAAGICEHVHSLAREQQGSEGTTSDFITSQPRGRSETSDVIPCRAERAVFTATATLASHNGRTRRCRRQVKDRATRGGSTTSRPMCMRPSLPPPPPSPPPPPPPRSAPLLAVGRGRVSGGRQRSIRIFDYSVGYTLCASAHFFQKKAPAFSSRRRGRRVAYRRRSARALFLYRLDAYPRTAWTRISSHLTRRGPLVHPSPKSGPVPFLGRFDPRNGPRVAEMRSFQSACAVDADPRQHRGGPAIGPPPRALAPPGGWVTPDIRFVGAVSSANGRSTMRMFSIYACPTTKGVRSGSTLPRRSMALWHADCLLRTSTGLQARRPRTIAKRCSRAVRQIQGWLLPTPLAIATRCEDKPGSGLGRFAGRLRALAYGVALARERHFSFCGLMTTKNPRLRRLRRVSRSVDRYAVATAAAGGQGGSGSPGARSSETAPLFVCGAASAPRIGAGGQDCTSDDGPNPEATAGDSRTRFGAGRRARGRFIPVLGRPTRTECA
jgi:hypothetical protein